ncbi:MAG: hypothetical protein RL139_991 [Gemmatimonadota bacterium]|jgi:ABC-type bacteriocin/lantibiotic exporter with double-glycine peptidase domain
MPNSLPLAVLDDLLGRLAAHHAPDGWREAVRRRAFPEGTAAEVVEGVVDAGRLAGVSFVRRTVRTAEWAGVREGAAAPLVLVASPAGAADGAPVVVAMVDAIDAAEWTVRRYGSGAGEVERIPADAVVARLAGPDGVLAVLMPVAPAVAGTSRTPLDRLVELLLLEKGNIGLVYAYATLVGLLSLTLPLGVQAIIGLVSGGLFLQPVVLLIAFVVAGTLATGVLQVLQLAAVERIQQRIFARLALEFAIRVPRVRTEAAWGTDLPERMNRFFEVLTIQKSLGKLLTGTTTALLQVVFGLLLLTFYHPYFTLFGLALVVLLALILRVTGPRGLETSMLESTYKYHTVHWLEEVARSVVAFKAAGRATPALDTMDAHVSGYLQYRQRHFRVLVTQAMAAIGFKTLVTGALLILGSILVTERQITLGQFVAAELVIVTVLAGIEKLVGSLAEVYDVMTSVYKLSAVTDLPLERTEGLALAPASGGMTVALDGVGYRYAEATAPALDGITFRLGAGERLALTGPDGSGETTLLAVIAGLLDGYDGHLALDGVTARDLEPAVLREQVGLLLGSAELFEGTVEENIALGRGGVGTAEVRAALARVGAAEAVQRLPQGLRTRLDNGGRGLPSTLRTRLLLARAIAARPRLLLVDECLATVEPRARAELIDVLTVDAPWTLVVVSHTRDLLAACDRVLVLHDGRQVLDAPWGVVLRTPSVADLIPSARSNG